MALGTRAVWRLGRGLALWLAFAALLPAAVLGDATEHVCSYLNVPAARRARLSQLSMCCAVVALVSWFVASAWEANEAVAVPGFCTPGLAVAIPLEYDVAASA
eukprot:10426003-Alexandrium_andersonii.AAC.1